MRLQDLKVKIRRSFVVLAIAGILLNFIFDLYAYKNNRVSDKTGEEVTQAYEEMLHLQRLDRWVQVFLVSTPKTAALDGALQEIAFTSAMIHDPGRKELLRKLSTQLTAPNASKEKSAATTMSEILKGESKELEEKLRRDIEKNHDVDRSLYRAVILDSLLFSVLLAFFFLEMRSNKEIEQNLTLSMNILKEANRALKEEQLKRLITMRTTVHDLKNPLGSIQGFAELISEQMGKGGSVQKFSETIKKISQNSLELVDSLLAIPSESVVEMSLVDLTELLIETCQQTEPMAQAKGQSLIRELLPEKSMVQGNSVKLRELIANLLSNAIKYSPQKGKIWVRCLKSNGDYLVEIEDQGPGFRDEDRPKAFQYGQRLSARPTGSETSTGIGLFTAKQIVELHHGRIEIGQARAGSGACLRFYLSQKT